MKKIAIPLLCLLLLVSCGTKPAETGPFGDGFVPAFTVEGDAETVLVMDRKSTGEFVWSEVENGNRKLPCLAMADVIQKAKPRAQHYNLLLLGADGLSVKIDGEDLSGAHIAFSAEYGWECVNLHHPVSSKVKMLQKIIVISGEGAVDSDATGLVDAAGTRTVTAGQIALESLQTLRQFQGRSETGGNFAEVYAPSLRKPVPELLEAEKEIAIVGRDGSLAYDRNFAEAALEIQGNRLDYVFENGDIVPDVAGLMADAPKFTVAEAYSDALYFLENGQRVLMLELDGWGWEMFQKFRGEQPYLAAQKPKQTLAAYPPISQTGLATLLTGTLPDIHGIQSRVNRQIKAPDLFDAARKLGKSMAYVEGDVKLIDTSLMPRLSPDTNGKNGTDDEVLQNAKQFLDVELLVVHFHGIDDEATTFGPYSGEVAARMNLLDGYVKQLAALWEGKIIVTADHGLHPETGKDRLGSHGIFCREDMVVPYIIMDGDIK